MVKPSVVPLFTSTEEERVKLTFSLSKEEYKRLEAVKAQLSNAIGKDLSLEALLIKLMDRVKTPAQKRKFNAENRYIPKSIKQAIYQRDNGRCCYQSPSGVRCSARHYLQVDHVIPFACGGKTELSNLRLLCPAHNRLMAEGHLGKKFIQQCIQAAQ